MEPAPLDRGVDTRALTGGVLVGVHVQDGLIGGRHRAQMPMTPERHADSVRTGDRGPGQGHHHPEGAVDHIVLGGEG